MSKQTETVKCTQSVMKKCAWSYRHNAGCEIYCDYMCKTGHSRGCPPEACNKFKKREKEMK